MKIVDNLKYNNDDNLIIELSDKNYKLAKPIGKFDQKIGLFVSDKNYNFYKLRYEFLRKKSYNPYCSNGRLIDYILDEEYNFINNKLFGIENFIDKLFKDYRFTYDLNLLSDYEVPYEDFVTENNECIHILGNCKHSLALTGNGNIFCTKCGKLIEVPEGLDAESILHELRLMLIGYKGRSKTLISDRYLKPLKLIKRFDDSIAIVIVNAFILDHIPDNVKNKYKGAKILYV